LQGSKFQPNEALQKKARLHHTTVAGVQVSAKLFDSFSHLPTMDQIDEVLTRDAIQHGVVLILRGLSGSGKTTLARRITDDCETFGISCKVVTRFPWWMCTQERDKTDQDEENACMRQFVRAIERKINVIIVDKVNAASWDYRLYEDLANEHFYTVKVVEFQCETWEKALATVRRSHYDLIVDEELIKREMRYLQYMSNPEAIQFDVDFDFNS
jgi:predicted kinase